MRFETAAAWIGGALLLVTATPPAAAISCSEREQVCFGYCTKNEPGPGCERVCRQIEASCLSTGCWESKIVTKTMPARAALG